jgi:hypothetical protein
MENPLDRFIKSAREVRPTDETVVRMRERLVVHMRSSPTPSRYEHLFGIPTPFAAYLARPATASMLLMLVVLSGVTASATTGALPGDTLYPLKVNLMEPMRGFFAFSREDKATWQAALTDTRLREVEQLAVKRKLTPAEGVKSQERFDTSLSMTQETIQELSKQDPDAAAELDASFTASLDEHERILSVLGSTTTIKEETEVRSFVNFLRSKIKKFLPTATTSTATSTATSTPSSQEGKEQVDRDAEGEVNGASSSTPQNELDL